MDGERMEELALPCELDLAAARIVAWAGGGNNRIAHVADCHGNHYALKLYAPRRGQDWPRLQTEFQSLHLLRTHGLQNVPRPLARSEAANLALYDWIDGRPVRKVERHHVNAALDFLTRLHSLSMAQRETIWPQTARASAACFCLLDVFAEIETRLEQFDGVAERGIPLHAFFNTRLVPLFERLRDHAVAAYEDAGRAADWHPPLLLSPSDFGFHNCLESAGGDLTFFDFEYFGWDDSVKLAADFLLHPGHSLPAPLRAEIQQRLQQLFSATDETWPFRFQALYPLYGVVWCLILLNEFRGEARARRLYANRGFHLKARLEQQFARAQNLCAELETHDDLVA